MGEQRGKLSCLVEARSQDTRNLLDQRLRGQESIIFLCWKRKTRSICRLNPECDIAQSTCMSSNLLLMFGWPHISRRKLTQLLHHFLVLVELFKSLDVHVWKLGGFSFITMLLVTKDTHGKLGAWGCLQPVRSDGLNRLTNISISDPFQPMWGRSEESYPYHLSWHQVSIAQAFNKMVGLGMTA